MPTIENIQIEDIKPTVPPEYKHLQSTLPLRPGHRVSFVVNGNNALANGIRRVIFSELPVKILTFDNKDFETSDQRITREYIKQRIQCIPVVQSTFDSNNKALSDGKPIFELSTTSTNPAGTVVKTGAFKYVASTPARLQPKDIIEPNLPIIYLNAGRSITIKNIHVVTKNSIDFGGAMLATGAAAVPLDVEMRDEYTNKGVSSSVSNPQKYRVTFETNGTIEPRTLIKMATANLISRLKMVLNMRNEFRTKEETPKDAAASSSNNATESESSYHVLMIPGETNTIGNIIVKNATELFPDIDLITYHFDTISNNITLKLIASDPKNVLEKSITRAIDALQQ